MIKTLLFDLGNVIVPFDFTLAYARLEAKCGYPREEVRSRIRATGLVQPFETGAISGDDFVRELSAALSLEMTYAEFCDLWTAIFLEDTLVSDTFLAGLRERYRLMLLSNTNPIHFSMIQEKYPLLRHFDDCVLSYEVGAAKPEAKIYLEALSRAECRPEECFFTDDLMVNIEAARRHGMDAVQFESAQQLERELRVRRIL